VSPSESACFHGCMHAQVDGLLACARTTWRMGCSGEGVLCTNDGRTFAVHTRRTSGLRYHTRGVAGVWPAFLFFSFVRLSVAHLFSFASSCRVASFRVCLLRPGFLHFQHVGFSSPLSALAAFGPPRSRKCCPAYGRAPIVGTCGATVIGRRILTCCRGVWFPTLFLPSALCCLNMFCSLSLFLYLLVGNGAQNVCFNFSACVCF
jgi:hypothetical protein